jgi:hypothetical protein
MTRQALFTSINSFRAECDDPDNAIRLKQLRGDVASL